MKKKEHKILNRYLKNRGMRQSSSRNLILSVFLNIEKHATADEIYNKVIKKDQSAGRATVYRTMKILTQCNLARKIEFSDGITRYEHKYRHEHHDHLKCNSCGASGEVYNQKIEKLQENMAEKSGFIPQSHTLTIYGICRECSK